MNTMLIEGKQYAEAEAPSDWIKLEHRACTGCALVLAMDKCSYAIDVASIEAFGGDCHDRDVVYVEVTA